MLCVAFLDLQIILIQEMDFFVEVTKGNSITNKFNQDSELDILSDTQTPVKEVSELMQKELEEDLQCVERLCDE